MRALRSTLVLTTLALAACGAPEPIDLPGTTSTSETSTEDTSAIDSGPLLEGDCDPIVPTRCGLPFPSNVYLVDDAKTATGKRVQFGATTLPGISNGAGGPASSASVHVDVVLRRPDGNAFTVGVATATRGLTFGGLW